MTFKNAVIICFQKYVSIQGRAARSEYWYFFLFYVLVTFALGPMDAMLTGNQAGVQPLSTLFGLAVVLPMLTVGIRRLHDRDMTGWWMLLLLVPLIGSIALLVIFVLPGTVGPNRFGPDPLGNDSTSTWSDEDDGVTAQSSIPKVDRE